MPFDPIPYITPIKGKDYLPVAARLIWFRSEHPDWSIITSPVEINLQEKYAIFTASILNAEGRVLATAHKMEDLRGFGDFMEKAETSAIGRALAMCGFGTQFCGVDFDEVQEAEKPRLADAPMQRPNAAPVSAPAPGIASNAPAPQPAPENNALQQAQLAYAKEAARLGHDVMSTTNNGKYAFTKFSALFKEQTGKEAGTADDWDHARNLLARWRPASGKATPAAQHSGHLTDQAPASRGTYKNNFPTPNVPDKPPVGRNGIAPMLPADDYDDGFDDPFAEEEARPKPYASASTDRGANK